MQSQGEIHINVIKPDTYEELTTRYTDIVFKIVKNRIPPEFIDEFIERVRFKGEESDDTNEVRLK